MEFTDLSLKNIIIFCLASTVIAAFSWRSLHNPKCHGFYRFFAFEIILFLILINFPFWFLPASSPALMISWILLTVSILFVVLGFIQLRHVGGHRPREDAPENYSFENTTNLVTTGIYKYIRHPMYSSLLLLAWGAYLKHVSVIGTIAVVLATLTLIVAVKIEERENKIYFGSDYQSYINKTRLFIPFIL